MAQYNSEKSIKSDRIERLKEALYREMPAIESARAILLTESYKSTEGEPMVTRRAAAFEHILEGLPIVIRDDELVFDLISGDEKVSDLDEFDE